MVKDIFESALYLETTGCNVFNSLFIMYFTVFQMTGKLISTDGTKMEQNACPLVYLL